MQNLDEKWFTKYQKDGGFSEINFLKPTLSNSLSQKESFLKNEIENPSFEYSFDQNELTQKQNALSKLLKEIQTEEENEVVKEVYTKAISEKLKIIDLLEKTTQQKDAEFTSLSVEIYGKPEEYLYKKALGIIKSLSKEHNIDPGDKLGQLLINVDQNNNFDFEKEESLTTSIKAHEIKEIFDNKLKELKLNFSTQVTDKVASITVEYSPTKQILIPTTKTWSKQASLGLVDHEIGVHVRRSENGKKSGLAILSTGLDNYLPGEEGLAMYMELEKNKSKMPGIINFLTSAWAYGLDNNTPKNFREIFELTKEYHIFLSNLSDNKIEQEYLNNRSWELAWRVFRGTTGNTLGACLTRENVYFSGYVGIKNLFESNDPETKRIFSGKYNPLNPQHIKILDKINNNS